MTEQKFDRNTWQTPKYCRNYLEVRFGWFDVDGAADSRNKLFPKWIGIGPAWGDPDNIALDFLGDDVIGKINELAECNGYPTHIYVNPPYSDVTPFLIRAKELRDAGHLVVMLLNNDKSTQWYQNHIHGVANEVIDIVGGRIAFIHPVTNQEIKGNSKGQMIVVFDPAMQDFVQRSVSLDFIKKVGGYDDR